MGQKVITVDFDSTITQAPDVFAYLTKLISDAGDKVVVVTGSTLPKSDLKKALSDAKISYDALVQYDDQETNGWIRAEYLTKLDPFLAFDNRIDRSPILAEVCPHLFLVTKVDRPKKKDRKDAKQDAKKAVKKALRSITLVNGPADGVIVEHRGLTNTIETAAGDLYWVNVDSDTADWIEPDDDWRSVVMRPLQVRDWSEDDHPRDDDGRFTGGGGGDDSQTLNGASVPAEIGASTNYPSMMTPDEQVSTFGFEISTSGDAVPGGYNGTITAQDPKSGDTMGSLQYNSASALREADIAMVEVKPEYQGQGVATNLLQAMRAEFPDYSISHGMQTDQGAAWVSKLPAELQQSTIPPLKPR